MPAAAVYYKSSFSAQVMQEIPSFKAWKRKVCQEITTPIPDAVTQETAVVLTSKLNNIFLLLKKFMVFFEIPQQYYCLRQNATTGQWQNTYD